MPPILAKSTRKPGSTKPAWTFIARAIFNVYRFVMIAWRRIASIFGVCFFILLTVACVGLYFIFQSAKFTTWIQAELSQRTGCEVRLAQLKYRLPFSVVADAVIISKPREFSLKIPRLIATLNPFDFFSKTVHRLDIETPVLQLDVLELSKPADQTAGQIALRYLNVHDGTIVLKERQPSSNCRRSL
jgi:hypothetical protein